MRLALHLVAAVALATTASAHQVSEPTCLGEPFVIPVSTPTFELALVPVPVQQEICLRYDNQSGLEDHCTIVAPWQSAFSVVPAAGWKFDVVTRAYPQGPWSPPGRCWIQTLAGDATRDGVVGAPDMALIQRTFGQDIRTILTAPSLSPPLP